MLMAADKSSDSFDPEFLTFRHNSPQYIATSGRSIYSQRFDYKSLQKYPIFDTHNSQREDISNHAHRKIKQISKKNQLRHVKSQEKLKNTFLPQNQFEQKQIEDCEYQYESEALFSQQSIKVNNRQKRKNYDLSSLKQKTEEIKEKKKQKLIKSYKIQGKQVSQRNLQLKSQLAKLIRNIKKQQRSQFKLGQQIYDIQQSIEQITKQIEEQKKNIDELTQIGNENMKQCNRIIDHIYSKRLNNEDLAANLQNLEQSVDSSQISIQTCRQDSLKDRMLCSQFKDKVNDLIRIKQNAESNFIRLEQQILSLQAHIQQMKTQQYQLSRIFGLHKSSGSPNNSTSQNFNSSHSYSHSRGSIEKNA